MEDSVESPTERRLGLVLLGVVLGVGAALRVGWALSEDGLYWPDEVYQSLEPAHRLVFGYGLRAWEYIEGARTWVLPALVAACFELSRALGLPEPRGYLGLTRSVFGLMGAATAWGTWRLARGYGASTLTAAAGAALFALGSVPVYFAPRALSENASALPVVLGLALALSPGASRRAVLGGASLLGVAVLLRLQNGVFCVALLGVLGARREWRRTGEALGVLVVWAGVLGLMDRLTWGHWFQSARVYLDFNLVRGMASNWGTAPFAYYHVVLARSLGPTLCLVTLGLGVLAARRAPGLFLLALAFWLLHALQPHKELRFLLPVLPVFAALAGVGLEVLRGALPPSPVRLALPLGLGVLAGLSATRTGRLTFGDIGQYEHEKPRASAWDDFGTVNRLLIAAGHQPDVCGLKLERLHVAWSGGYSYFHRDVPLYSGQGPGRGAGVYNYVITPTGLSGAGTVVATQGPFALVRLGDRCAPDRGWSSRLP
ncbi:hypothetical protein [Archangium primigenium]|uniref:hypothetical protein n=1 Tax=[Archangium] primigenium TaxID=2792470 RepID=UPI00195A5EF6|nr:hypothetical protein [Archangium primigenium]MBM7113384.1 hypothetical protein [Archangium primigenium]